MPFRCAYLKKGAYDTVTAVYVSKILVLWHVVARIASANRAIVCQLFLLQRLRPVLAFCIELTGHITVRRMGLIQAEMILTDVANTTSTQCYREGGASFFSCSVQFMIIVNFSDCCCSAESESRCTTYLEPSEEISMPCTRSILDSFHAAAN